MIEGGNLSITNTLAPTNKDLIVVFSPAQNIVKYSYTIYKNNNIVKEENINSNQKTTFSLTETGNYHISIKTYNNINQEKIINSGNYIIDKEAPVLGINTQKTTLKKGETPNNIVTAYDNHDGNITNKINSNISDINFNQSGDKVLTYTVKDEAGNIATQNINIRVLNREYSLYAIQFLIYVTIIIIGYLIIKFIKANKLTKRIEPFTIKPLKIDTLSLLDKIINWYQSKLKKLSKLFEKSTIANKYSKILNKYSHVSTTHNNGIEIFISKVFVSLLFVIIAFTTKAIQFQLLNIYELLLPLIIGFFSLDIIYFFKYKIYRNKLENDLLSAIIIMNNAFKAGRSIVQAIDIVSKELKGEIADEFSKMSLELSYGLNIDDVFKRFASRIKLEEINYLTASLTILNKTGGNIIEVFTSIEKTMFNKKKLKLELKSLTASSKIILYVLFVVPFLFILFISIISPGYFMPFIETSIGQILLVIMLIYYILFIIIVRKIMRVVI